jgi:hypothetical protein
VWHRLVPARVQDLHHLRSDESGPADDGDLHVFDLSLFSGDYDQLARWARRSCRWASSSSFTNVSIGLRTPTRSSLSGPFWWCWSEVGLVCVDGLAVGDIGERAPSDTHRIAQAVRRMVGKWVGETYRRWPMIVPTVIPV